MMITFYDGVGIFLLCTFVASVAFGYLLIGELFKKVLFFNRGNVYKEITQTKKTIYRVMAIFWLPLLPVFLIMLILDLLSDIFTD